MNLFKDLVKKYGLGMILGAATLDGYRRQIINERKNNILEEIQKERNSLSEDRKIEYDKLIDDMNKNTENTGVIARYKEAANEDKKAADNYTAIPTN